MKKLLILALIILPCLSLVALDLGVGLDLDLSRDGEKIDSSKAAETDVELRPALILMLTSEKELQPFLILGYYRENDPDSISAIADDYSYFYFGLGAGLYYRIIQRDLISLSAGPRGSVAIYLEPKGTSAFDYDSYFDMEFNLALPVYLDVQFPGHFLFRTGVEVPGLTLAIWSRETGGIKYSDRTLSFTDFFQGLFNVYFGFYYILK